MKNLKNVDFEIPFVWEANEGPNNHEQKHP